MSFFEVFKQYFVAFKDSFVQQLANPSWDNPFYIIPAICVLTFILELTLPRKREYSPTNRKGFWQDLFYVIFIDYLVLLFGFWAFAATIQYFFTNGLQAIGIESPVIYDIKDLPYVVQFFIIFILFDFMQWLGHFLLHRVNFLWKFHKIHHAQETLGFASTRHFHWVEFLVFKPLLFIVFMTLNLQANEFVVFYLWVGLTFTFFSHCNVKVNWKWFNYIFISPETHYWHHAKKVPQRYGVNFASTLTIWDHLFGYFYYPQDKGEPELGVDDQDRMPKTFIGQFFYPFKHLFSKEKERPLTRAERRRRAKGK